MIGTEQIKGNKSRGKVYTMTGVGVMAAMMCVLGPMSIPIGPVPISFTNLVIYLAVYLLEGKWGAVSYGIYMMLGICGLPVFSGYTSGIAKLAGPTGGFLIGFIFMVLITGVVVERAKYQIAISIAGMVVATAIDYLFGTIWFVIQANCSVEYALGVCVFPFLIGDLVKIVFTAVFGRELRQQFKKAGLL
ncbi:MAG: biotin transporter BioY [Clostridium sp.]|nr:biotin transporter BioY [Clostridium sp.]